MSCLQVKCSIFPFSPSLLHSLHCFGLSSFPMAFVVSSSCPLGLFCLISFPYSFLLITSLPLQFSLLLTTPFFPLLFSLLSIFLSSFFLHFSPYSFILFVPQFLSGFFYRLISPTSLFPLFCSLFLSSTLHHVVSPLNLVFFLLS